MKTITLAASVAISRGAILALTDNQLGVRRHLVLQLTDGKAPKGLTLVEAMTPLSFKAGETLTVDETHLPKGIDLPGDATEEAKAEKKASTKAIEKARAEGVAAGRAAMLAEVEAYNTALDELDAAEAALAAAEGDAVADATKAVADAEAKAEALKPKA